MSRVLARNLFKKKAPKQSSKGVGITAMLEDDVPGYAEGGEVSDDRTERERMARQLLEQNRDEYAGYQQFSEQERPRMYRPPATTGVMPQPNPQQMQAAQMQQMAAMGMIPRFADGGPVEVPSMWSRVKDFMWNPPGMDRPPTLSEMRRDMGRSIGIPSLTNTGISSTRALENPNILAPVEDPNALTPALNPDTIPTPMYRNPVTARLSEEPQPRQFPPEGTMTRPDSIGGERPVMIPNRDEARILRAQERTPVSEDEAGRESRRARALSDLPFKPTPKEERREEGRPGASPGAGAGAGKETDLSAIKSEREAKAAAARQENIYLALMQAGLAIAGGRSPNAITNIGQGGQAGLASFMALEQQRRRDEDAAMRRDLAEREYGLQVRRQQMQEPYMQAQTEYLRMRPAIAAAQLQARQQGLLAQAQMKAVADIDAIEAKNPLAYSTNGKPDQMKKDIAIQRRTQQIAAQYAAIYGGGGGPMDRLGLGLGGGSADEE